MKAGGLVGALRFCSSLNHYVAQLAGRLGRPEGQFRAVAARRQAAEYPGGEGRHGIVAQRN